MSGVDINWGILRQGQQPLDGLLKSYQTGQEIAQNRTTLEQNQAAQQARGMLATDPAAAKRGLLAAGRVQEVQALQTLDDRERADQAHSKAQPLIDQGDFTQAAKVLVNESPETANAVMQLDRAGLQHVHDLGERGASVLMSTLQIPDPAARRTFAQQHRDDIIAAGIPAENFDSFDWGNTSAIQAEALKWMGVKDLAGSVHVGKYGDDIVAVRESPTGVRIEGRTPIPESRAEKLDRQRLAETKDYHQTEEGLARDRIDLERAPTTTGKVLGPIYAKLQRGEPLTPGEQKLYDDAHMSRGFDIFGGGYGDEGAAPPPAATTPKVGINAGKKPATPATPATQAPPPAAVAQLREGTNVTFSNGQTWTLKGGKPTRVK